MAGHVPLSAEEVVLHSTSKIQPRDATVILGAQMRYAFASSAACAARCSINPCGGTPYI